MKESVRKNRRSSVNGTRNVLTVNGKKEGLVYRFVNDVGDRVASFKEMGYEVVTDSDISVGDKRVATPSPEGSAVMASVGNGVKGVLMAQKKEYYDEDQRAKQAEIDKLEASIKRPGGDGVYGEVKVS